MKKISEKDLTDYLSFLSDFYVFSVMANAFVRSWKQGVKP